MGLDVNAVQHWKQDRTDLFQDPYDEYLEKRDEVREAANKTGSRVPPFNDVLQAIVKGEANGLRKYSNQRRNRDDFEEVDWAALLLVELVAINRDDREGVLYGKVIDEEEAYHLMWSAVQHSSRTKATSRKSKGKGKAKAAVASSANIEAESDESNNTMNINSQADSHIQNKKRGTFVIQPIGELKDNNVDFAPEEVDGVVDLSFDDLVSRVFECFDLAGTTNLVTIQEEGEDGQIGQQVDRDRYEDLQIHASAIEGSITLLITETPKQFGVSHEYTSAQELAKRSIHPYKKMELERKYAEPNTEDRFWQYYYLRNVSKSKETRGQTVNFAQASNFNVEFNNYANLAVSTPGDSGHIGNVFPMLCEQFLTQKL